MQIRGKGRKEGVNRWGLECNDLWKFKFSGVKLDASLADEFHFCDPSLSVLLSFFFLQAFFRRFPFSLLSPPLWEQTSSRPLLPNPTRHCFSFMPYHIIVILPIWILNLVEDIMVYVWLWIEYHIFIFQGELSFYFTKCFGNSMYYEMLPVEEFWMVGFLFLFNRFKPPVTIAWCCCQFNFKCCLITSEL